MGSDIVVSLRESSAHGTTLFGLNFHAAPSERHRLLLVPGGMHDPGEVEHTATLPVPQARQTYTVLGMQPREQWGFVHGVNEHRVVLGVTDWTSRLPDGAKGLDGPDLVRLALERSRSAHHGIDVLTDLLERHAPEAGNDLIFLIADANEAFVLEASGHFWALLECSHTRVVTDAAMIRQDWRRLAPGLANFVIDKGWWQDDGSKIDFVRCLSEVTERSKAAQKRWGRASLALAQQQGAIDAHFLRRMLADHYTGSRDLVSGTKTAILASSFLVELPRNEQPLLAWVAYGTPKVAVHFPICFVGELPAAFSHAQPAWTSIEERAHDLMKLATENELDRSKLVVALEHLQTRFDQDAEDFLVRAHEFQQRGKANQIAHLATAMMNSHVDLFDKEFLRLFGVEDRLKVPVQAAEEMLFFA